MLTAVPCVHPDRSVSTTLSPVLPLTSSCWRPVTAKVLAEPRSSTSVRLTRSVLLPEPVRSMTSMPAMRLPVSGSDPAWLATCVRSSVRPPPDRAMVSLPLPPSMRASWARLPPEPMGLCRAVTMALPMLKVSSPPPPYSTLAAVAVRVSLPRPATRVLATLPSLRVSLPEVPIWSTALCANAPLVLPKIT